MTDRAAPARSLRRAPTTPFRPRVTTVLLVLMVAVGLAFLIGLIASRGETNPVVNVWLSLASQWVPVSIFWLVAARQRFRLPEVVLAATAVTVSAVGDTYYSLAMDAEGYLAFPSPADAGYLLFYPLMVAALVVLARRQLAGGGWLVLLECAVACVGAAAVLAVLLDPVIKGALASANVFDSAVAAAYPLFDLILLAAVVGIIASPRKKTGARWWSLVVGLSIFVAADIVYALLEYGGSYIAGSPLDASWTAGLAFITWWAVGLDSPVAGHPEAESRSFVVPIAAAAVLAGLGVLIFATQVSVSVLAVALAGLTVGLAAVPVIFREAVLARLVSAQKDVVRQLTDLGRSKSDMMVTMNHEFRTPLTTINGYVEVLLDGDAGDLPDPAVGMLRKIESNAARLQELVDDLLVVSRLEEGGTSLHSAPRYLAPLISRAADTVRPLAAQRGVMIDARCDDFTLVVEADPRQLERAFAELIENGVKFTPKDGSVTIVAEATTSSTAESVVRVRVIDTGMGIPAEDIPRLWTTFFRASNVQDAAIPGEGLGLPIARGVVDAHGGCLTVDSTVGVGTTMTVQLPLSPLSALIPRR